MIYVLFFVRHSSLVEMYDLRSECSSSKGRNSIVDLLAWSVLMWELEWDYLDSTKYWIHIEEDIVEGGPY